MKQKPTSLSVPDFMQMIERLCASTASELQQTRARMQNLRDDPPG